MLPPRFQQNILSLLPFWVCVLLLFFYVVAPGVCAVPRNQTNKSHSNDAILYSSQIKGKQDSSVRILFIGDTSFGENYQYRIKKMDGIRLLKDRGYGYCIEKLTPLLTHADLVIANLETPLTNIKISPYKKMKRFIHWGDIVKTPLMLSKHNITVVSLANNHTLDFGIDGLRQTLTELEKFQIESFGAGLTEAEATAPYQRDYVLDGKRFRLVVAAGFKYSKTYDQQYDFYAQANQGGVNNWIAHNALNQIRSLREKNPTAFIIAFPHWGSNYCWKTKRQSNLGRALIGAGADLVIGHGAHMMQEIELYRQKWIVYGLGNFMFMSPGRYAEKKAEPYSLAARLDVSSKKKGLAVSLRLYPLFSDNRKTDYQPRRVTEAEFARVRKLLMDHSPHPELLKKKMHTGKDEAGRFLLLPLESASVNKGFEAD